MGTTGSAAAAISAPQQHAPSQMPAVPKSLCAFRWTGDGPRPPEPGSCADKAHCLDLRVVLPRAPPVHSPSSSSSPPPLSPPTFALIVRTRVLSGTASPSEAFLNYEADIHLCDPKGAVAPDVVGTVVFSCVDFTRTSLSPAELLAGDEDACEYTALLITSIPRRARSQGGVPQGELMIPALRPLLPGDPARLPNLLLIHKITLLPPARGRGLAVPVLKTVLQRFRGDCRLAALLPYPLQHGAAAGTPEWQARMNYKAFRSGKREAIKKLKALYGEAGFLCIRGTSLMVAPLS